MKRIIDLCLAFSLAFLSVLLVQCLGGGGGYKPKPDKIYKIDKKAFKSETKAEKDPNERLKVKVCFQFDEKEKSDLPIYIIPPEKVISFRLKTATGATVAPCALKAFKLNPSDDPEPRARGDLVRLEKGKNYCEKYDLKKFFKEDMLPDDEFELQAVYFWSAIDPELKPREPNSEVYVCPDGNAECYTIWQGLAETKIKIPKEN